MSVNVELSQLETNVYMNNLEMRPYIDFGPLVICGSYDSEMVRYLQVTIPLGSYQLKHK